MVYFSGVRLGKAQAQQSVIAENIVTTPKCFALDCIFFFTVIVVLHVKAWGNSHGFPLVVSLCNLMDFMVTANVNVQDYFESCEIENGIKKSCIYTHWSSLSLCNNDLTQFFFEIITDGIIAFDDNNILIVPIPNVHSKDFFFYLSCNDCEIGQQESLRCGHYPFA